MVNNTKDPLNVYLLHETEVKNFAKNHNFQGLGSKEDPIIFSRIGLINTKKLKRK